MLSECVKNRETENSEKLDSNQSIQTNKRVGGLAASGDVRLRHAGSDTAVEPLAVLLREWRPVQPVPGGVD